jgi:2-oxoglutarate ferredoxin oxidoreductase subunit gamma
MHHEMIFAGFGGQGIMTMGTILATAGMREGKEVAWLPSYGAEQRGGTANCTVVVSDREIASPMVDRPSIVVVMNQPSLDKFEPKVAPGGTIFVNSSLVTRPLSRSDLKEYRVPVNEMAGEIGSPKVANMVMLAVLVAVTGMVEPATLEAIFKASSKGKARELMAFNLAAIEAGRRFASSYSGA